jgi:hypothetical protein
VTGYELDNRDSITDRGGNVSLHHRIQIGYAAQQFEERIS